MDRLRAAAVRFSRDGRGTTAIEYALIAGLIFLAVVGSLRFYTSRVSVVYDTISAAVTQSN
ncbi:Flp family type IVb pilin [Methylobacterium phyllosphaerae]